MCLPIVTRSQTRKIDSFFLHNSRFNRKNGRYSQEKCWFVAEICLIWELIEYKNDDSPNASIIPTF